MGPYIDKCVSFQIISNRLNLPQVDSNHFVEKHQDDQWKQDAPELNFIECHGKDCEYISEEKKKNCGGHRFSIFYLD